MPSLSFLLFPDVVYERILANLGPQELLDLSLCSLKTRKIVKSNLASNSNLIIRVEWKETLKSISIVENFEFSFNKTCWKFEKTDNPQVGDIIRVISGSLFDFHQEYQNLLENRSNLSIDEITKFFKYFMDIFGDKRYQIELKISDFASFAQFQEFPEFKKCSELVVQGETVPTDILIRLLEDYDAKVWKSISCEPDSAFDYDTLITGSLISIAYGYWINRRILLNFDCEAIRIIRSTLTSEDFNAFIKKWFDSSDKKLEYLNVRGKIRNDINEPGFTMTSLDLAVISRDLPAIPGATKRPEDKRYDCFGSRVPHDKGVDIRRADGTLATAVVYQNRWRTCSFLFQVWKDPNPNLVTDNTD